MIQPSPSSDVVGLHDLLRRTYVVIQDMLDRLRESQSVIQHAAVQNLQVTSAKLHEVTSATESAATDIMDGIDRALQLVDKLDAGTPSEEVAPQIRDELFAVMNHLQFQDITTQQLQHASSLIQEMERQLDECARMFDLATSQNPLDIPARPQPTEPSSPATFDPCATVKDAEERQALVDAILTGNA
jgi:chemotaxis regulatin CheY-phosphate phosphatase CheZ